MGLGQRTGRQTGDGREAYLLDLTKPYHNLLGMVRGENEKSFYWDGNVAAMAEKDELHYYLQDELGSTVRVSGYDAAALGEGSAYLTYGYDEFGNDLYSDLEEAGIPNPYSRQGEGQPFGYTGYRYDDISGTYFAQAREYQPQNGRFTAEDVVKGNGAVPETLNRYGYCWSMPLSYVDRDGKIGYYFYDPDMFCTSDVDMDVILEMDLASLREQYQTKIEPIAMTVENGDYESFEKSWESMGEKGEKIDVVVIMTHSFSGGFVTEASVTADEETGKVTRIPKSWFFGENIEKLDNKEIGTLYLLGCNMGLSSEDENDNSLACNFYKNKEGIGMIIAADGNIQHGYSEGKRTLYVKPSNDYHSDNNFDGFKKYEMVNGELVITKIDDISVYWGEISSRSYGVDEEECKRKKEW